MKAKKLIEVAMPIKEISAESVRDKSIRHGHISTLHLWWARRPLPACRAIVFGSLVPDPDDEACPQAFKDAVAFLLGPQESGIVITDPYKPYKDIPYTAIVDPMDDTLRNRLMMFIGKFSDKCQENMIAGKSTSPKEQLSDGSLIKWENKNNAAVRREKILIAMIYTVISILAVAILSWIMFNSLNTPEVEVSWSTKQCIRVVHMDGTTDTCDNKPEKYDIVWVK